MGIPSADEIKGKWKQHVGEAKIAWGKLTDDDLLQSEDTRKSWQACFRSVTPLRATKPTSKSRNSSRSANLEVIRLQSFCRIEYAAAETSSCAIRISIGAARRWQPQQH